MAGQLTARRKRGRLQKNATINVTPFVDLMLVLLIIFMVAAPQMTVNLPVELPQAAGSATALDANNPALSITMSKDEQIMLNDQAIERQELITEINALAAGDFGQKIIIRGDKGASYGAIISLVSDVNAAGYHSIALDAQQKN